MTESSSPNRFLRAAKIALAASTAGLILALTGCSTNDNLANQFKSGDNKTTSQVMAPWLNTVRLRAESQSHGAA